MPSLEGYNLHESNEPSTEVQQIIEKYKNAVDKKINAAANALEAQNNVRALTEFKEIKDFLTKNNMRILSILELALTKSFSLYSPLREKSIASAKSMYEITAEGIMTNLDIFLRRYNITIDNTQ